jgi:hypothetical protein
VGIHADSRFAVEYAFAPARTSPNSCPAARIAPSTSSPSAHGPNSSNPGIPAMPCRSARTRCPAMTNSVMLKNPTFGSGSPVSFSSSGTAFGPCSSYRYTFGGPDGRS